MSNSEASHHSENYSHNEEYGPPKKKSKLWYQQTFKEEWLEEPELKDWVKPDPNDNCVVFCSVCDCKLNNCNKNGLRQHSKSSKHKRNLASNIFPENFQQIEIPFNGDPSYKICVKIPQFDDTNWNKDDSPIKKPKVPYRQAFKDDWMSDPDLMDWIKPVVGDKYAVYCTVCDAKMKFISKFILMNHKASSKHRKNWTSKIGDVKIHQLEDKTPPRNKSPKHKTPRKQETPTKHEASTKHETHIKHEAPTNHETPPKLVFKSSHFHAFNEDWLKPDKNNKYVCTVCNIKLWNCTKAALLSHKDSSKHKKNLALQAISQQLKDDHDEEEEEHRNNNYGSYSDGESSQAVEIPPKKKSASGYLHSFKTKWLSDPDLKDWLRPVETDMYAVYCTVCEYKLRNCNKLGLMNHKASSRHWKNLESKGFGIYLSFEDLVEDELQQQKQIEVNDNEGLASYCEDETHPENKSKPLYKQPFNKCWLNDPHLKDWIKPDENDRYIVHCTVCDCKFKNCNISGFMAHNDSSKHKKNFAMKYKKNPTTYDMDITFKHLINDDNDNMQASYSGDETQDGDKPKFWYLQAFKKEWMDDPKLKDWLKPDENDKYVAYCTVCDNKFRNSNKNTLMKHQATTKHLRNMDLQKSHASISSNESCLRVQQSIKIKTSTMKTSERKVHMQNLASNTSCVNIQQFIKKNTMEEPEDNVHKAEVFLAAFMAEHGAVFSQGLIRALRNMFPDCETTESTPVENRYSSHVTLEASTTSKMPTLEISTNVPKEKVTQQVLAEMTKTLSTTVGKSADYCIVRIAPDQLMMFGGSSAPCAAASLSCIGKLGVEENKAHAKAIFDCVEKHLGVPNDRVTGEDHSLVQDSIISWRSMQSSSLISSAFLGFTRMYIEFRDLVSSNVGYKGTTFHEILGR